MDPTVYIIWWARVPGVLSHDPVDAEGNPTSGWGLLRAYTDKDLAIQEARAMEDHCECRVFGVVELGLRSPDFPLTDGES